MLHELPKTNTNVTDRRLYILTSQSIKGKRPERHVQKCIKCEGGTPGKIYEYNITEAHK